ncbi:MAG: hypothetical protein JRI57_09005 [Deltaproteobacteria bacterium]|nr:hypothetical protein [Deltaproteobacteria bacterium]MBW1952927.1 hypothetical protein [Deltaproteobacteria bacterium]MBW1987475.1 hypothetical protein [Deltaproteobacteria bacterium]MBW2135324.1 hypothetical protein [Deltaproteobacteria bacterium]
MSKVIQFSEMARQQQLHLLEHKRREFQEREDYLGRMRKLLFQVEAQMRQAELEQYELYRQLLENFQIEVNFPNLGDRVGLQRLFAEHPALLTLSQFLEKRLDAEECYNRLKELQHHPKPS